MLKIMIDGQAPISFQWGTENHHPIIQRQIPVIFEYTETADYIPLFIELDTDDPPMEIAAMINGEVKGAAVYTGEVTEILLYLDEEDLNEEIEIVFAYNTRSTPEPKRNFGLVNRTTKQVDYVPLIVRPRVQYYHIKFTEKENNELAQPFIQLQQNYPNPFNPDTRIDFYISHDDFVTVSIFNIRGQRVKDVYRGPLQAGKHHAIWDGTDSSGKPVSSGVYMYRLQTRQGSVQRRMALIK
jgi:hypothetical protein